MRSYYICFLLAFFFALPASAKSGPRFQDYFADETMRIDYFHIGDAKTEIVTVDRVYEYGTWAGSLVNLVDNRNYGAYYYKIYDAGSGELIFSRGFDSYFKEYQTTEKAKNGVMRTFQESAIIPLPKSKIAFALEKKQKDGNFEEVFRCEIDPEDNAIIRGEGKDESLRVYKTLENGDPHKKLDIAIIAEGYTAQEEMKFKSDLKKFTAAFFKREPCKSHMRDFNMTGVFKASAQSGVDEPGYGSFKNTAVGATFNSMGSARYLLTESNKALHDIASCVPYDALFIMVNHGRYGGGGIYNFYCTFTTDNQWSEFLMVHESGHSIFGLADEYYTSSVAYEDFYPAGYEPSEPNITALLDPKNVKWKHLISGRIDIPTPWNKTEYDKTDIALRDERKGLSERIAELYKQGVPETKIMEAQQKYDRLDRKHVEKMERFLSTSKYAGKVGAFEGAGYASSGMYRPMMNCIMFTKGAPDFCKVCQDAMEKMIDWYTE